MNNEITIGGKKIGPSYKPFIIAEMSGNHNKSLERALAIVDAAADAGADAIKLQTYTADTMTLNVNREEFKILDKESLWYGRHLYELYEEAHTPWDWHQKIINRAKEKGIICFSTPFDETAVDFLEALDMPAYKISSFENCDVRLIKKVSLTGKPVIISLGMANFDDLQLIVNTLLENNCDQFVLLKCTSAYPALPSDANLKTIPRISELFNCQVGLSDHSMGCGVALAAVALGATIIEKHFTLFRSDGGVDSAFSLEPAELKLLVEESKKAWQALGKNKYEPTRMEEKSKQFKRSIYFVKEMKPGEIITEDCIRCIRPGYGMPIAAFEQIIGRSVRVKIINGTPVTWDVLI